MNLLPLNIRHSKACEDKMFQGIILLRPLAKNRLISLRQGSHLVKKGVF